MTTLDHQRPALLREGISEDTCEPLYKDARQVPIRHSYTPREFALYLVGVLAVSAITYLLLAGGWGKFSRAEVFFAECAKEMIAAGNWMVPLFHNQAFFDKPILSYWAILSSFSLLGINHLTARIPSCLGALTTIALIALTGRQLFGARAGVIAGMALSTSAMYMSFAAMCMSDVFLVLFNTAALVFLYLGSECSCQRKQTFLWFLGSVASGLAFLTKGPIGILFPFATFLTYLAVTKNLRLIRPIHCLTAIISILFIGMPWFLSMYFSHPEGLWHFFLRENVQRFAGSTYDSHQPIWFMVHSLVTGFAPWSLLLIVSAFDMMRKLKEGTATRPLIFWWLSVVIIIGFFSLSRGKIDYYALPAYPACALLAAAAFSEWIENRAKLSWAVSAMMATVLIAGAFIVARLLPPLFGNMTDCALWPLTLLAFGLSAMFFALRRQPFRSVTATFLGIAATGMVTAYNAFPLLDRKQPMYTYIDRIAASSPDTKIGIFGMEHWKDEVTFRTGKEAVSINTFEEMVAFFRLKEPIIAIVPDSFFSPMLDKFKVGVYVIESYPYVPRGLNPGYILESGGHIVADSPLLLISNRKPK